MAAASPQAGLKQGSAGKERDNKHIVVLGACGTLGHALCMELATRYTRDHHIILVDPSAYSLNKLQANMASEIYKNTKGKVVDVTISGRMPQRSILERADEVKKKPE